MLKVGNIYRLKFPGIAARVIEPPPGRAPKNYPFLMESLFLRSRWYVNARGEPRYPDSPRLVLAQQAVAPKGGAPESSTPRAIIAGGRRIRRDAPVFCDIIVARILAFQDGFVYVPGIRAVFRVAANTLSGATLLNQNENIRQLAAARERLSASVVGRMAPDYPDLFSRRMRFSAARLQLVWNGRNADPKVIVKVAGGTDGIKPNRFSVRTNGVQRMTFEAGDFSIDLVVAPVDVGRWDQRLDVTFERGRLSLVMPSPLARQESSTIFLERSGVAQVITVPASEHIWSFEAQARSFIESVRWGTEMVTSGAACLADLAIIDSFWKRVECL
jgi:hypothetical protein